MIRNNSYSEIIGDLYIATMHSMQCIVSTKDRTGRVGPGRTGRHTPVSATGRPPSLCRPRPTCDVTAGHILTLAFQMYTQKDEEC